MRGIGVLLLIALSASALRGAPQEKILLPIAFAGRVAGAHGSLWKTELVGRNNGDTYAHVGGFGRCAIACTVQPGQPRSDFEINVDWVAGSSGPGRFLYVEHGAFETSNPNVTLNLRVRDLSRFLSDWGTEIRWCARLTSTPP